MFKTFSVKSKKYRLALLLLSVVAPGLIISGFGIISISQQEKAKELKLEEKFRADLELIRKKVEEEIGSNVETVFQQLFKSRVPFNQPTVIQPLLKEIILKNSIVKYPFLIDSKGKYIFPFSKKIVLLITQPSFPGTGNKKIESLYREGERFEFRERKIGEALKRYVKCLTFAEVEPLKPYIFNAIARCYFKSGKYPQALSYYQSILGLFPRILSEKALLAKVDYSLYFQVLRQMAQSHQRLGRKDKAMRKYLQLYDALLQYETSHTADRFAFFKNEALEYLNQYIKADPRSKVDTKGKTGSNKSGEPDRLKEFSGADVSLRWRYFEYDRGPTDDKTIESYRETGDISRFEKIREFYLYTDEKTQFYKAVKGMKKWDKTEPPAVEVEIKKIRDPVSKDDLNIVIKRLPGSPAIFFGFMISPDFLHSNRVSEVFYTRLNNPDLLVFVQPDKDRQHQSDGNNTHRFPLLYVNFDRFFTGKTLALYSRQKDYFIQQARKEIRLNYLLMGAFILILIFGIFLFYKYLSREAELVRLKSEFTDRASHTLKTPLTRIRLVAEKLQLGWVTGEAKKQEYLQTILTESDRMNEMVTNMLDFSRVEAGRKQYNFENLSLPGLVKEVLESYTSYIKNFGFQLEVNIDENIPSFLLDANAIRLIVVNLLQNAVKYSNKEKSIIVRLFREEENAILEVEDRGIGIEKENLSKIFEQFQRASADTVQSIEGSGLGLYLVRHAVHAHGGKISVVSEPGKGSRFTVLLPMRVTPDKSV